nr:MAG TPA: hypothetical protein [Caudoviricetes sp.]
MNTPQRFPSFYPLKNQVKPNYPRFEVVFHLI